MSNLDEARRGEIFEYLSELRASAAINIYSAPSYMQTELELSEEDALAWFKAWAEATDDFDVPANPLDALGEMG